MEQAHLLDADEALCWVRRLLNERQEASYERALQVYASALPAFAYSDERPDPPEPPEEF